MTRIAQVTIQADYFRKTVRAESSYPLIWRVAKEVIQNSRDAGASTLNIFLDDNERSLRFVDDAGGMDADTVLDTFLALGGSKKDKEIEGGSIGGFGDAKKVIFLCWDKWEMKTQDLFLTSEMLGKQGLGKSVEYLDGTSIKVWIDTEYDLNHLISYIQMCQLDMVINVFHNGNKLSIGKLFRRKMTRDLGFGKLYVNKSNHTEMLIVRLNGLALFYRTVYGMRATAVLELEGENLSDPKAPTYPLNVTREDLRWQYKDALDSIIRQITSNPLKAFKEDPKERIEVFHGAKGKVKTQLPKNKQKATMKLSDAIKLFGEKDSEGLVNALNELNVTMDEVEKSSLEFEADNNDMEKLIEEISKMSLAEMVERAVNNDTMKKLEGDVMASLSKPIETESNHKANGLTEVFPYDFIVKGKTNLRYDGIKYQKILLAWHKAIEYVSFYCNLNETSDIDLGQYTVGFVFDDDVKAQYIKQNNEVFLLINPTDINFTNYTWRGVVMEILLRACHEIAHNKYIEHDGNFVAYEAHIRNTCIWYIDELFSSLGNIVRSKKDNIVASAMLDEEYDFEEEVEV